MIEYTQSLFLTLGILLLAFIVFGNTLSVFESIAKHLKECKVRIFQFSINGSGTVENVEDIRVGGIAKNYCFFFGGFVVTTFSSILCST